MSTPRWWEGFSIGRLQILLLWRSFVPFDTFVWYGLGPEYDAPTFREVVVLSVCFRWWYPPKFTYTPDDTQEAPAVR
jgi:hypothetical protein